MNDSFEPYHKSQRERAQALEMLALARKQEREKERLVAEGKLQKIVDYDPIQRLTRIWYKEIKQPKETNNENQSTSNRTDTGESC